MSRSDPQWDLWLAQAGEAAKLGYWVWRHEQVSGWNPSSDLAMLGLVDGKAGDLMADWALSPEWMPHPGDASRLEQTLAEADRTRSAYRITYRLIHEQEPVRTIYEVGVPTTDPTSGDPIWAGIIQDLTEQKALEEQLLHAQKLEAIGRLSGGIAHDFNNILGIITGYLELTLEQMEAGRPGDPELLRRALAAAERGAALTHRLLALARKQALRPSVVDANRAVHDMSDMIRRAIGGDVDVRIVNTDGLWRCEVDLGQLENALLNLVVNARDAMPEGGRLTIETSNSLLSEDYAAARAEVAPGEYVLIAVSDTGMGMPPEIRERVLEPFFTTKNAGHGNGLGLSTIHGFVKQSGGHLALYSEVGVGTTVKIYLPRYDGDRPTAVLPEVSEANMPTGTGSILLVEDNAELRAVTQQTLESLGYSVETAASGAEAIAIADRRQGAFDILVTDVIMPGEIGGGQLAKRLSATYPHLAVLFVSGFVENAIVHHGRLDPSVTLLSKPFQKRDLALAIRKCLDAKRQQD